MYTDPSYFLNGLLHDLGEEQDAEEWAYDPVAPQAWFTANHPDGRLVQVWVDHVSGEAVGYQALSLQRPKPRSGFTQYEIDTAKRIERQHSDY